MKMTKRDFYERVAAMTNEVVLSEFAAEELRKMDEAAAKRRDKVTAKQEENAALGEKIINDILDTEIPKTATDIGEELELSPQKVTHIMKALVEAERAEKRDVKVTGKKGTHKGYVKRA